MNKHAPIRRKRVKHSALPGWLSAEIKDAMRIRDSLKQDRKFAEYKQQRNKVTQLVRSAKKAYFEKLIANNNGDTAVIWRAMNELTNKSHKSPSTKSDISADTFNDYFLSVANTITNGSNRKSDTFKITPTLSSFLQKGYVHLTPVKYQK